jgi:hypothetical protein
MLNDLQKTMQQQPQGNVANALRQAVLGVFGSQVLLVMIAAVLASLKLKLEPHERGWWIWLAGISLALFMLVSAIAIKELREKNFVAALRAAILLGAISSLPAVFAALLFVLEGSSFGAWIMVFVTTQSLIFSIAQVSILSAGIKAPIETSQQTELEIVERFQGLNQNL